MQMHQALPAKGSASLRTHRKIGPATLPSACPAKPSISTSAAGSATHQEVSSLYATQTALPSMCQRTSQSGARRLSSRTRATTRCGYSVAEHGRQLRVCCQATRDTNEGASRSESVLMERQLSGLATSTSTSGNGVHAAASASINRSTSTSSNSKGNASASTNGNGNGTRAATDNSTSTNGTHNTSSSSSSHQPSPQLAQEKELAVLNEIPGQEQRYEALVAWVGAAMAFGGGIWYLQGPEKAQEFFAGYLLEQSLSVDNLFVFILVFNYFKTPPEAQKKVLTWGIATAAVLRGIFIVAGVELIEVFEPLLAFFAAILIWSSYKIIVAGDDDDDEEDLTDNAVVKVCRRFIPTSNQYDGDKFWTMAVPTTDVTTIVDPTSTQPSRSSDPTSSTNSPTAPASVRIATPLLLTLAVVELSDVLFAVDSIPAVFGVTLDPFIIYSSNIFAILSLRALYSFVSNVMSELRFLDKAVAVVLGFIGCKMLLSLAEVDIPTDLSLLVVGLVLGTGVTASLLLPEPADTD